MSATGSGSALRIRTAGPRDAAALLDLKRRLDQETSFMMFEPGERDSSIQDLARELDRVAGSPNSVVIVAELGGRLVGYVQLIGGSLRRSRATAYVVIGVRAHAAGRGIGTELLRHAKDWATGHHLHRLELTVMAHNSRAIRLYERMGFSVEGAAPNAFSSTASSSTSSPWPPSSPAPSPDVFPANYEQLSTCIC